MKQQIFRLLADLRFSIFLLLLISFCSIVGTVIEQDQSIEIYKTNYPLTNPVFGVLTWDRILLFGLDHVYRTWWFFALIFLFGLSLILCTFLQQLPSLKIARRCQFFRTTNQFYRLKISTVLNDFSFNKILGRITGSQYSIFQQKNIVYCYKGLIGRIAPILVHLSMILILVGTIVGSLFGFKAQEIVPKTENFHIQNILANGQLTVIPKTSARINDFWITYTKTKTVSQFYSDISILNKQGNEIERKTISVNHPLIHNGVYYYQTDWNLVGLRFKTMANEIIEYPLINFSENQKIWLTWISTNKSLTEGVVTIIDNLEGYCSIYNETGQFLGNIELNEIINLKQPLTLIEIISSTGLQIKTDPGIQIIYSGFFFLMLSTLISYITYSQIWIIQKEKKLFIGGTTNRAVFDFELEFFKIIK
jgi:cytochrome c biogenesis protein|uniref:Cytochrome c biogenesis protein Ccs1 n=2 Tax=Phaeodactylum tricornutum TaxID=2850 RepID=CCS1_PHATC|nr:c-type cytochrome biogenensis protein [Phaeodactylum tricornutum]A0T0G8.1 RecName: Full=Cytochrome c biogenesis protein Ccs1 [Phaeodactylum tricornutum CCAP 1055/1]ABK20666.1 cytochrome c biogenesis protein [Phaeodactylum tricornutum]QHR85620.1 cytochrome c biogenesis protein [Phaeodactylum tricornutum]